MTTTSAHTLQITLNGAPHRFTDVHTVRELVAALKLDARKVAVEKNLTIVPRSAYADTVLCDGDAIEIVGFIGGG